MALHWMGREIRDDWIVNTMVLTLGQVIFIFAIMLFAMLGAVLIFCGEICFSFMEASYVQENSYFQFIF
jgi:hypothetical protein